LALAAILGIVLWGLEKEPGRFSAGPEPDGRSRRDLVVAIPSDPTNFNRLLTSGLASASADKRSPLNVKTLAAQAAEDEMEGHDEGSSLVRLTIRRLIRYSRDRSARRLARSLTGPSG
jgi:hypothetical protein